MVARARAAGFCSIGFCSPSLILFPSFSVALATDEDIFVVIDSHLVFSLSLSLSFSLSPTKTFIWNDEYQMNESQNELARFGQCQVIGTWSVGVSFGIEPGSYEIKKDNWISFGEVNQYHSENLEKLHLDQMSQWMNLLKVLE